MNTKLLLGGGLVAALLLFGKPKASKSASKTEKESEVIPDSEEVEEKPPAQENKPTYPQLNTSRLKVINELLKVRPMFSMEPFPYGNYTEWAKNKYPGTYQEWLSNIAYWKISRAEKKTDLYTELGKPNPEGYTGEFPFFLRKSTKGWLSDPDNNSGFKEINFPETDAEANARLKKGIALWKDINKYIIANLKGCPPSAKCG
jgi:hypothetical protein